MTVEPDPHQTDDSPPACVVGEMAALPPTQSLRRPRDPSYGFLGLVVAYAIADFTVPLVFDGMGRHGWPVAAFCIGALGGEICLGAIWAALGPSRFWPRWLLVLAVAFALYLAFCFGIVVSSPYLASRDVTEMIMPSLLIPLLFLVIQMPLWVRRIASGWQILDPREVTSYSATEARQFGLANMLGLMAFLAVALSLVQIAASLLQTGRPAGEERLIMWLGLGIYSLILCLYIAVLSGPAVRACFLARDKVLGCLAMAGVWVGVSILVVLIVTIIAAMSGGRVPGEAVASIFLATAGTVIVLMASLHLLRMCGYVMVRAKDRRTPIAATVVAGPAAEDAEGTSPFAPSPPQPELPPRSPEAADP